MTEFRIRCSGKGRKHSFHVYTRRAGRIAVELEYLEKQAWTVTCRPFIVEIRTVGEWSEASTQKCEHGETKPHPAVLTFGVDYAADYEPYTCPGKPPSSVNVGEGEWISET